MLQTLSIKNVALIKELSIDFSEGFNVLLGETGAGKSIIFDSLNFVLGGKGDKTLIRSGESEMRVDAIFSCLSTDVQSALSEFGFEGEEISLSRTMNLEGRSAVRINGIPAVQTVLKSVGQVLVDSYSQHEGVELLKTKNHLLMLDKFGGGKIADVKTKTAEAFSKYREIIKQKNAIGGDEFERERVKSLLEYQIREIEEADLMPKEDEELQEKLKFMQSAEKIYEAISLCEDLLSESTASCMKLLKEASSSLSSLSTFDEISQCRERLDSVRYEVEDISQTLSDIKSGTEYDEREFERVDRRLDLVKSMIKKYGGSIEKTLEFLKEAKDKANTLADGEFLLAKLEKEEEKALGELKIASDELTNLRKQTAQNIEKQITQQLRELGMKSSMFEVKIESLNELTANGKDNVEFVFSANKGQEMKSLAKTASGGELSRFMLAVKNIFSQINDAQTLVFDEIDSGISGETGNIVGEKLNNLSSSCQVLCITHLPQVASYADAMFFVSKRENGETTQTFIEKLQNEGVLFNLAKMTVGDNVSQTALNQAREMREKAGKPV